jgi:hypothetical protein
MAFGYFRSASRRVIACSRSVASLASLMRTVDLTSVAASFSAALSASATAFWLWSGSGELVVAMLFGLRVFLRLIKGRARSLLLCTYAGEVGLSDSYSSYPTHDRPTPPSRNMRRIR